MLNIMTTNGYYMYVVKKKKTVFAFILALILETSLGDQGI